MLTNLTLKIDPQDCSIPISEASFPAPFPATLEYSSPARGNWNIVHLGMLVPEAHQIYICGAGCLRGVVLTAAEMNAMDRFSSIVVEEHDLIDGTMETFMVDAIVAIVKKLHPRPKAIILFPACIHHFLGTDLQQVYTLVAEQLPDVDIIEAFMDPIMQKKSITPDQRLRRQIYSVLKPAPKEPHSINFIGNEISINDHCELVTWLKNAGFTIRDITTCNTYQEFQNMARSSLNLSFLPAASYAVEYLKTHLDQPYLYIPFSFDYEGIREHFDTVADYLGIPHLDCEPYKKQCNNALENAKRVVGNAPISIDYTATSRPFSLARLLVDHGFNVEAIYTDSITADDEGDFHYLQKAIPQLCIYPTIQPSMGFIERQRNDVLAIGQKAAYFNGTNHFVNIVAGGGLYGYTGICKLTELMTEAWSREKDTKDLVQRKGWGCTSCL